MLPLNSIRAGLMMRNWEFVEKGNHWIKKETDPQDEEG